MTVLIKPISKTMSYLAVVLSLFFSLGGLDNSVAHAAMATVTDVEVADSSATLKIGDSAVEFDSYTLGAPSRLVVDVKNVLPAFEERSFTVDSGFSAIRVGLYADKTRFVFDGISDKLPLAEVKNVDGDIVVDWSGKTQVSVPAPRSEAPVSVDAINFDSKDGVSSFTVDLNGAFELVETQQEGDTILFGVKDAVIPRSLRRVVDASVFPSSILQITPYSTIIAETRNVMFSAKMKGPVEYAVKKMGNTLEFSTVDGVFAETSAQPVESVYVPVETVQATTTTSPAVVTPSSSYDNQPGDVAQVIDRIEGESAQGLLAAKSDADSPKIYTGEPVTLMLDDADVRKVMQLIAEISDLNIILSDDVSGKVSLRLHDVPWDQALDLILDIKQLGTIRTGNVVRVLPLKTIKNMEAERLKAVKDIKKLEETQTEVFVVSYKDTKAIEDVIEDVLSNQGEVQVIDGSKKIMVNDIPSKLDEIRALIAELDEPVKQVMIEARIVEMRNTEGLDLGVNWGLTYQNDALSDIGEQTSTYTDPDTGIKYDTSFSRTDGVLSISETKTYPDGTTESHTNTGDKGGIGNEILDTVSFGLGGAFLQSAAAGTAGLGSVITFGRTGLDSTVLDLRISALETSGEAKVVSSPKVLTLDGESARIEQGTSIPYQSTSDNGTTTEFEDATLSLEVKPEVNPDGTVILEILASNSSIGSTVSTGAGSAPAIDTKEAETKLLLKSGETTVIGGIYVEANYHSNTGTPFLKDIPYLGKLFESNSDSRERNELLIFITPHIVE
nr:type IV pilus secretin PilQ [uncultured Desulfuromonas sp.]